jgi:hypothetical protein
MSLAEKIAEACQRELHAHSEDDQSHKPRHHVVRQVARAIRARPAAGHNQQLGPDRPYVLSSQRGLGTDQLAFVPSNALRRDWDMILMVLHGGAPQLLRGPIMRRR